MPVFRRWNLKFPERARNVRACCLALLLAAGGCARVDSGPDVARTVELIGQRTGAAEAYDPALDETIRSRVDELWTDGLTVEEAVQVALLNNRALQAQFQEIGVSRAEVVQSGLFSNPTLALSVRFPEGGGRSNLIAGLAQQLADLWQIPVRKEIAQANLERTILTVAQQAVELATQVRTQYYRLLVLERVVEVNRENFDLVSEAFRLVEAQVKAGQNSPLDANLARVAVFDVQRGLIALERDLAVARVDLLRTLGLTLVDGPDGPVLEGRELRLVDVLPAPGAVPANADELLRLALERRLDAQAARLQVEAAEASLVREYLDIFPSLELGFEAERLERRAMPGRKLLADTARASVANGGLTAPDIESRGQRRQQQSQVIDLLLGPTLSLTLPLWDQNQAQIAAAKFRVLQARKQYEDVLLGIAQAVQRSAATVAGNSALVAFYEQQALPLARQNQEGARNLYQSGQETILVLIDSQRSLINQRSGYVEALGEYAVSLAELELAVGGRLPIAAAGETPAAPAAVTQPAAN